MMYLLNKGGKSVPPFHEASHVRGRWRASLLAEPDQTPHITMWHYGYGRLLRCGCAGSMRREGYGGCAGAVVLGYGRSAPLNTAVECSSSPQHRRYKAKCRRSVATPPEMASDTALAASGASAVLHAPAVLSCRSIPDLWPMDRPSHSTSWSGIAARAALPGEAAAPASRFQRGRVVEARNAFRMCRASPQSSR